MHIIKAKIKIKNKKEKKKTAFNIQVLIQVINSQHSILAVNKHIKEIQKFEVTKVFPITKVPTCRHQHYWRFSFQMDTFRRVVLFLFWHVQPEQRSEKGERKEELFWRNYTVSP